MFPSAASSKSNEAALKEKSAKSNAIEEEEEEVSGEDENGYDTKDFISGSFYGELATFERDPLELEYSYGYECGSPNMCVVEPDTLLWYTGNIIHIFDAKHKKLSFRRSALGQDISFIVGSKGGKEFAIGENGGGGARNAAPMIIVYAWPDFRVVSVLKGGAAMTYKCADFSSDGLKLVSQAGPPDDTLTIWDLEEQRPLCTFQNPDDAVIKALFSPFEPHVFMTCGRGHIKFWRLVETFTGLKIECEPGRFGEIENNDVSTLYFLPDGRIVSNFCGGNLAIWRPNAMLELNFSMKNDEPCHSNLITFIQIYVEDNHVYTAGFDGKVRVWNYSYIESFYSDDQEDATHIEIEPSYERAIKDSQGKTAVPVLVLPKDELECPYHFYAQDSKGGIWILDLELKKYPDPWTMLYVSHTGRINDICPSPGDYYFASLGDGGKLHVYSHSDRILILSKQFNEIGTSILWLPLSLDRTGCSIVVGFNNGAVRMVAVHVKCASGKKVLEQARVTQLIRPHSSAVTALVVNKQSKHLVSGSDDASIFIYGFTKQTGTIILVPLGLVKMPARVCHIVWNPYLMQERVLLATCTNGEAIELTLRDQDLAVAQIPSTERDTYVLDIPTIVTRVKHRKNVTQKYFSKYLAKDLIWIEGQGSEHKHNNHIYQTGGNAPVAKLNISGGINVHCAVDSNGQTHMVLGLSNGRIRVIRRHEEPNNYDDTWEIVMHKTRNTAINRICFSYDSKILYSCGSDSGLFAYKVNFAADVPVKNLPAVEELPKGLEIEVIPVMSLEEDKTQNKMNKEKEQHGKKVDEFKEKVLTFLTVYYKLIEYNKSLPKSIRVPKTFFRLETKEEREKEKLKMLEESENTLAPLKERQKRLFERVNKIKKHFIDPIQTPKFYLFAVRGPYYLKSFPERKLFSRDPFGESPEDEEIQKQKYGFGKLLAGQEPAKLQQTEFERMVSKILTKIEKEREIEACYEHKNDAGQAKGGERGDDEEQEDEVPDLITAAGDFLVEYDKFTPTEKHIFKRINDNRLKRAKCRKEMSKIGKLQRNFQQENEKIDGVFKNLIKSEVKDREVFPPVTEKLHDLLNLRQLIYLNKEAFNKSLKNLRQEKTKIINYYYWAQEEHKYMSEDMKLWGLSLGNVELPPPLEVAWDLEYPDTLKFKPGPMPECIAGRMALYEKEFDKIKSLVPVQELAKAQKDITSHTLFQLIKYRQERFANSATLLRDTLDKMTTDFDKKFLPLLLERSRAAVEIYELKSEYTSIIQEVDVLSRFATLQTSASGYKYEVIKIKHVHTLRENIRKKKIVTLQEQAKECQRTIEDLNAKFYELVHEDKWAKHLTRTYKRRYKPPKGADEESEESEESSSDDDDDDDDIYDDEIDDDDDDQEPSGAHIAYLYDETILPPGCDEEHFKQTFKYRSQRHMEENKIAEIKRERERLMEEVKAIRKWIKVTDVLLAFFFAGTFRFQKLMKEEMDDIEYLVKLHPSQIQIFNKTDPFNAVPPLDECKLIEQDDYLAKVRTMEEMKGVIKDMDDLVSKTQRGMKAQVKELRKLVEQNAKTEDKITHVLNKKFGTRMNVDDAQTYVLTQMIKKAIRRSAEEIRDRELNKTLVLNKLDAEKQKEELIRVKKDRVKTLQTLYTIEAEKNRITAEKLGSRIKDKTTKTDLEEEKNALVKTLAEVEDVERKLMESLKV